MTRVLLSLDIGPEYGDCEREVCPVLGCAYGVHDALWCVKRVARDSGMYWPFVVLNGERELLEGSLPNRVKRIPRDAMRLSPEVVHRLWTEDNESHVMGGPNVAKMLRDAVAMGRK